MNRLTQRHRAQQLLLRRATGDQIGAVWPTLDYDRLDETYPILAVKVAAVVKANRLTSNGLAAAYLREMRREARVAGSLSLEQAPGLVPDQLNASLRALSVARIKNATAAGSVPDVAMSNGLTSVVGGMARIVLDAGRTTITRTLASDSHAVGYERVLGGAGCDFCQMLAGRGEVYSAESADFEAHDHCGCTAEPIYRA